MANNNVKRIVVEEEKTLKRMVRVYEAYIQGLMNYAEASGVEQTYLLELQNEITNVRAIEAREIILQRAS